MHVTDTGNVIHFQATALQQPQPQLMPPPPLLLITVLQPQEETVVIKLFQRLFTAKYTPSNYVRNFVYVTSVRDNVSRVAPSPCLQSTSALPLACDRVTAGLPSLRFVTQSNPDFRTYDRAWFVTSTPGF